MKATRDGFGQGLIEAGSINPNLLVLGADLSKATKADGFAKEFPDRFIECGIQEANMIGIASGLSEHGYRVVISSFASFLTGRYDILRCSLAYPKANVLVVGTHAGMAIGKDGVTQMGLEDLALMTALPNFEVFQPASYSEALKMTKYLTTKHTGPAYLRLGRQPVPDINTYSDNGIKVQRKANPRYIVLCTGCVLNECLEAAAKAGTNPTVINVSRLKPFDRVALLDLIQEAEYIWTVEDHSTHGGLGSLVSDVVANYTNSIIDKIGIDVFPESGKPEDLYEKYGLSTKQLLRRFNLD